MLPRAQPNSARPQQRPPQPTSQQGHYPNHQQTNQQQARRPSAQNLDAQRQRRLVADKLIHDCYSKMLVSKDGRKFPETSYQTHIHIAEFSSYPSSPPPSNLPPNKIGTVKNRILAICVKYSGRVLLQKGKYNEAKNVYQIGRTWDMDELKAIRRTSETSFILTLNKDYYWQTDEGVERLWKFSRALTSYYGGFMGRYPELHGFSLSDFKLAPTATKKQLTGSPSKPLEASSSDVVLNDSAPDASRAENHTKDVSIPPPPPQHQQDLSPDFYKDFDFTSNGKLPAKPMMVMQVDRPSFSSQSSLPISDKRQSSENVNSPSSNYNKTPTSNMNKFNAINEDLNKSTPDTSRYSNNSGNHPYQQRSPLNNMSTTSDIVNNDSQSFVFEPKEQYSPDKLHEYAKQARETSPLRNFKPIPEHEVVEHRNFSEPLETVAALGMQLQDHLEAENLPSVENSKTESEIIQNFAERIPEHPGIASSAKSPDFGIEEITDESDSENFKGASKKDPIETEPIDKGLGLSELSQPPNGEYHTSTINSSIQEIENMLDSHISKSKEDANLSVDESANLGQIDPDISARNITQSSIDDTLESNQKYSFDEGTMYTHDTLQSEPGLNIVKKDGEKLEKDPEVEELFDDLKWSITDDSDSLIKKLTRELNNVKQQNVRELIGLNFGSSNVSKDVGTSINEVENLSHIFKKMEIDFKFLSSEVDTIENNSQGLQVKSINRKLLYNDLRGILSKVSVNSDDLRIIEGFTEFDRLNKLENLELALLDLFNALSTIKHDPTEDDFYLSSMRALKQFDATYERVTSSFIKNFIFFAKSQFKMLIEQASSDLIRFKPHILLRELNNMLIYTGITYFVKECGAIEFQELNQFFNALISNFLESLIKSKLKRINYSNNSNSTASNGLSQVLDENHLRKSRTLRLSRKRFGLNMEESDDHKQQAHLENVRKYSKNSNEIEDPKAVVAIIDESKDLISIIQFFVGTFFHYDRDTFDYDEFMKVHPYSERRRMIDDFPSLNVETLNDNKNYSTNELIGNMTTIFGNFINIFMKRVNPVELNIPLILIYLETVSNSTQSTNQEFLLFNFLKKSIEKYKNTWTKFIEGQIELLNNSLVVAKSGVLPSVKNVNQLLLITESSLENNREIRNTSVRSMVDLSYKQITEALIHLFMRDDPLLKNNDLDDKEREYRNVSIIQNIYYILEQLDSVNNGTSSTRDMNARLETVFKKVEDTYFQKLLTKNIGKLIEFVNNYEALDKLNRPKKYNKKYVKSLLASYTQKEVSLKVHEIYKKLEKHYVTGSDMFEKDLVEKLWEDMENSTVNYFTRLNKILRNDFDRDIEYNIGKQEIHSIFKSIH
ncbi:predicted protein [Scheffersomyces stipitis CBS 6054]|uniref:Exocyst complex component Sec3 PIP2-binding N-terminal domain-containing protein n=1 Tax=Scheffersomyces stipitis (strain ATCC 58785 / CBS 6054 / NBRC 10063 / NRRL Y-11545) TaxID=322104 RepID=A3GH85_PICST|nr:predicted protein [Scheffersomyces stipitis CBS 6054]EAZ63010.2 predicted protein [Scheffersomyces stipitis CBS 6054]